MENLLEGQQEQGKMTLSGNLAIPRILRNSQVGDTRLEHLPKTGDLAISEKVQASVQVKSPISDLELAILVEAWPILGDSTKASILDLIRAN